MIKIYSKKYEIEEPIQLIKNIDGKEEIVYNGSIRITEDEALEVKNLLFGSAKNKYSNYLNATAEEKAKIEEEVGKEIKSNEEKFIDICFKEEKEKIKDILGEYKFEELINEVRGSIMGFFMKKQISHMNTPITDLTKIMNNLKQYK